MKQIRGMKWNNNRTIVQSLHSKTFYYKNYQKGKTSLFFYSKKNNILMTNTISNLITFYVIKPINLRQKPRFLIDLWAIYDLWSLETVKIGKDNKSRYKPSSNIDFKRRIAAGLGVVLSCKIVDRICSNPDLGVTIDEFKYLNTCLCRLFRMRLTNYLFNHLT